jgi:hypothetical protein
MGEQPDASPSRVLESRGATMTDETTPAATPEDATPEPAEAPAAPEAPPAAEKHGLKHDVRDAIGKVVGIAVETGSMLSGNSGEIVSAEGAVAEADTEKFIDSIDGDD